jgi:iron complex outermembrane receptor protein
MYIDKKSKLKYLIVAISAGMSVFSSVHAEEAATSKRSVSNIMLEEVVITGTKKATAANLQEIPIAVTAYNEEQLDILHIRDLKGLSYNMPNVSMDEIGTVKGIANFSFRGLGINSSIASVDPTVGVFVDGVYMGSNYGLVLDQFDLAGVEVLRGPQGVLFGRNVTGGAVVINTKNPTEEFEGSVKTAVETGLNKYVMTTLSGPLVEDKLLGKLAIYHNNDDGWFKNLEDDNNDFGESETTLIRAGLTYLGDEGSELTVKYERGGSDGDGPASQNHGIHDRETHNFAIDGDGFYDANWDFVSAKFTMDLGNGVLTNIMGWRDLEVSSLSDVDGTTDYFLHAGSMGKFRQMSEELRYNVSLNDAVDLTAGVYYFDQEISVIEQRNMFGGAVILNAGGNQEQTTTGIFLAADWRLNDKITLNGGIRYTAEEKSAEIATYNTSTTAAPCDLAAFICTYNFQDDADWSNISPKLAVQWFVDSNTQVYASYSKGFRSGGYNMRSSNPNIAPGPYDEEEQDAFELGVKMDAMDGRLRLNTAVFHNTISDMQREVNVASASGPEQSILNTVDATITGIEAELSVALTEQLLLSVNAGLLDGDYDKVRYDLTGDGLINDDDKNLALPRLSPLSGGVSLTWQNEIFDGHQLLARLGYSHRDKQYYTDSNLGYFNDANIVDANITFTTNDQMTSVSVFARNLRDEVSHGGDSQLTKIPQFGFTEGGEDPSFAPLGKGRTYGVEATFKF